MYMCENVLQIKLPAKPFVVLQAVCLYSVLFGGSNSFIKEFLRLIIVICFAVNCNSP